MAKNALRHGDLSEVHKGTGADKKEMYSWSTRDKPGELCEINKRDLHIDESYQRELKRDRVMSIAREWSWVACGALIVALRQPGEWFVIDGGHRFSAAMLRSDIERLPCIAFAVDDLPQEATGFLDTNTKRGAMTVLDRFKALVITKDHAALVTEELIAASGRRLAPGGLDEMAVSCVSSMIDCINQNEAAFRCIWPIVSDLCRADNVKVTQYILRGMFYLETHLPTGFSLTEKRWKDRIMAVGHKKIEENVMAAAGYYGSRGQRPSAMGIANAINRGLHFKLPFQLNEG